LSFAHPNISLTVVIADDHTVVRAGLIGVLTADGRFAIVAEASDGLEAIAAAKHHKPGILLVDIAMPVITGLEVVEEVRRWSPDTKIAVMTGLQNRNILKFAIASGADGLFLKGDDLAELPDHLVAISQGETRLSPSVQSAISEPSIHDDLTRRERQIMFGLIHGGSTSELAARLGISINTINNHRNSLMQKLEVHSLAELMTLAVRDGLLESISHSEK